MAALKVWDGTSWQLVAGQGSPGQGVPAGGTAGQYLAKASNANHDTTWSTWTPAVSAVRTGSASGTTNGSGDLAVTFPSALPGGAAYVVVCPAAYNGLLTLSVTAISSTGFTVRAFGVSGGGPVVLPGTTIGLHYIAAVP